MDEKTSLNETSLLATGCKLIAVYFILNFIIRLPLTVSAFWRVPRDKPGYFVLVYGLSITGAILVPLLLFFLADRLAEWVSGGEQVDLIVDEKFTETLAYLGILFLGFYFIVNGVSELGAAYFRWSYQSARTFKQNLHYLVGPLLRLFLGTGLTYFASSLSGFLMQFRDFDFSFSRLNQEKYIPFITLGIALVVFFVVYLFS